MTASRGRRCARSALMRPTTHRVKVEETSDIGSPLEPTALMRTIFITSLSFFQLVTTRCTRLTTELLVEI